MKPFIAAALVATLATSAAFAQAAAPTTPATPPAAGAGAGAGAGGAAAGAGASTTTTFTLAAADQTKLKDWITMQKTASVAAPAGVTVAVGSTLPGSTYGQSVSFTCSGRMRVARGRSMAATTILAVGVDTVTVRRSR